MAMKMSFIFQENNFPFLSILWVRHVCVYNLMLLSERHYEKEKLSYQISLYFGKSNLNDNANCIKQSRSTSVCNIWIQQFIIITVAIDFVDKTQMSWTILKRCEHWDTQKKK